MATHNPHHLRLIRGELDYTCRIGLSRIGIIPLEAPSPEVDAVVVEQDTHGLLAVETQLTATDETLPQITGQLVKFVPYHGGEVVVKRDTPLQLLAIVHDLEQSPSWREEWIVAALERVLQIACQRHLRCLGMAPLGTLHGRFPLERFIPLLVAAVSRHREGPEQIWLGVARRDCQRAIEQFKQCCTK